MCDVISTQRAQSGERKGNAKNLGGLCVEKDGMCGMVKVNAKSAKGIDAKNAKNLGGLCVEKETVK